MVPRPVACGRDDVVSGRLALSRVLLAILVATAAALCFAAVAKADLAADQVERFIASVAPVTAVIRDHPQDLDALSEAIRRAPQPHRLAPFAAAVKQLRSTPAHAALKNAVAGRGFADPEEWAEVADRITRAYATLHLSGQRDALMRRLDQARRAVENNPRLSASDKEALLAELSAGAMIVDRLQAPEADTRAVEPYLDRLREAFSNAP
ncbi:MAG: hypothetical protein EA405_12640 [Rhodospirillales bacterium]|nr:MAG: hypothetical protein EA405_12640 [Rhodospirillales bacterium]